MSTIILPIDQQAKLIEDVAKSYAGLLDSDIREEGINFRPFDEAIKNLKQAVPEIAAHAEGFYYDDMATESDMRELYPDGFQLVTLFVLLDALAFNEAKTLGHVISTLEALGNDVADLSSYAATWNYENGQFDL